MRGGKPWAGSRYEKRRDGMTMDELVRRTQGRTVFIKPTGRLLQVQATRQTAGENDGMSVSPPVPQSVTPQVLQGIQRARPGLGEGNSGNRIRLCSE